MAIEHRATNPFPFRQKGGNTVVDAECHCDHLMSQHFDRRIFGAGKCGERRCRCDRFGWNGWKVASSAQKRLTGQVASEYALLLAAIAIACYGAFQAVGCAVIREPIAISNKIHSLQAQR
jgi:hypothetical protein